MIGMLAIKICGGAILLSILGLLLSELGFRGKKALSTLGIIIFLLIFIDLLSDAVSEISSFPITDEGRGSLALALKIVGVGHAFNICADVCTELSEGGIASAVSLVGKLEILLMVLPTVVDLIKYSTSTFL